MISSNGLKRKSSTSVVADNHNIITSTTTKRFRGTSYDGKIHHNEHQKSLLLLSTTNKTQQSSKMTIHNSSKQEMTSEYRQLQYELQCQEALLVLMQKLKTNQRIISQTNNTNQRTTTTTTTATTTTTPVHTTKLNSTTPTKQSLNLTNRSIPTKPPHPNQYTVNRSNNNLQQQTSKSSQLLPQATRQSTNSTLPITATRLSSTSTTKNSSLSSSITNNSSKSNGITTDQHLLNAKLALRKQLEQTLLQIPTPKPSICDLTYIPGINGWAEFLTLIGLEQAYNTYTDIGNRRFSSEFSISLPYICAQCGTDWSVTWHDISSINDNINNKDEKILCDRCRKTSQKKILKQDHSNRLRQAFMKALQQEKELDAKFQQQSSTIVKPSPPPPPSTTTTTSSSHHKPSNKSLTTKINSNHQSNKHTNNNNHHHSGKTSSSKHSTIPVDTFTSALAALPTNEQIELFQKHFLSNMFPFAAVANQAAALAAKTTQQQQQVLAASLPAMAASLMRQGNPAQYLLDMIPQAAKQQQQQQQQQHHRHSK
ncbi:unnamed protein product [Rotaria sp. Silwood1]|nr:unnamed protein product [Rotaria sp. Silwood1]CAF1613478.1 unnamed protein product [Rotaria sp. Silwood1]CAF3816036.1 unnamed protein product [Rotaria sp. Silwood1]CAF3833025.1 unnamed protein product [Rotaria sp. Silwood1]CAF4786989.1 unnamed protein product [Rotaria sp. Silwood1]